MDYDIDLGPWLIGDHYHTNVSGLDWVPLYVEGDMLPEFGLLNGKGVFNCNNTSHCNGKGQYFEQMLSKGKKYKIGIVGSMTLLPRYLWIDGHTITVIQMDMIPIVPYVTDVLVVGTGQRYEIIIEANAKFDHGTDFWINAPACNDRAARSYKLGIIRYRESPSNPTWSLDASTYDSLNCHDPDYWKIAPIVQKTVGRSANKVILENYLRPGTLAYPDPSVGGESHFFQWTLKDGPQHVDWANPALKQIMMNANPGRSKD
ncbi:hypothetical protein FE257_007143 [Aspergillus nanangensis]|uniref:Plastocyanin-like domain-containing protein n=1 Tax=Aspergillus nanangensis TaxID=2582783 RepID=A0AAD4CN94_ASPNN|nr:hypothetical protein FE257_007143 [Aspergillus nanangensis]